MFFWLIPDVVYGFFFFFFFFFFFAYTFLSVEKLLVGKKFTFMHCSPARYEFKVLTKY